jgi:predicted SAM-dependent methyltransferase
MSKPSDIQYANDFLKHMQNHDKLVLLAVKHATGRPGIVLAIRVGDTMTPVAEMLSQEQCDAMSPDWDYSEKMIAIVDGARDIEDRTTIESFQNQYPKIDEYFENADF